MRLRSLAPWFAALFLAACGSTASSPAGPPEVPAEAGVPAPPVEEAGASQVCEDFEAALRAGLEKQREKQALGHAALAVSTVRCGKRVVFSDAPQTPASSPASLWRIGSVTKTFVAATVLDLANAGKIGLEDALVKYLPTFPNAANITLHQLLNHTSGVFEYLAAPPCKSAMAKDPLHPATADELIAFAAAQPPYFAPGAGWRSANTNFTLLGRVIEKVTGQPLAALLREHALDKASLADTFFDGGEAAPGLVVGTERGIDVTHETHPAWWGAAGAIVATPSDLLDWASRLYGTEAVLSAASKDQMFTTVATDQKTLRYGLGMVEWNELSTGGNGKAYGHMGSVPGYQTEVLYFPDTKSAVASFAADSAGVAHDITLVAFTALGLLR